MTDVQSILLMSGIFGLTGIICILVGFSARRRYLLIRDIPRSKIRSMAAGLVEIHGSTEMDTELFTPLRSPVIFTFAFPVQRF